MKAAGESRAQRARRVAAIRSALLRAYPDAHCELNYSNPLELLVATILSAQCSDRQVNKVTEQLFQEYPTASHYAEASIRALERTLRPLGLYRTKARNLRACCRRLVQEYQGRVPSDMRSLQSLAGVGRKTANVILGNAFGLQEGIVVDTHVTRLSRRLGLSSSSRPEKIEQDLMAIVPRAEWALFSHWIIWHGRRRCLARKPDCPNCELQTWCPSGSVV